MFGALLPTRLLSEVVQLAFNLEVAELFSVVASAQVSECVVGDGFAQENDVAVRKKEV